MINLIKRYKLDWGLFLFSCIIFIVIIPLLSYVQGSIDFQYRLYSVLIIAGLSFFFLSCCIHCLPKIKQIVERNTIDDKIHLASFFLLSVYVLFLHSDFYFFGDELTYLGYFSKHQFVEFLLDMYYRTSPTILIHALVGAFVKTNPIFWQVFDSFAFIILVESIVILFFPKEKRRYSIALYALFLLLPPQLFSDTGWCATTLNYLWPTSAALVVFIFYKRALFGEQISLYSKCISVFLLLLAGNCIQANILMFFVTLATMGWIAYNENFSKIPSYLWLSFTIIFLSLTFIILCPGNETRAMNSMGSFPTFNELNVFQKLHLGFINACTFVYGVDSWAVTHNHFPFVLPLSILLCTILYKKRGLAAKICIPIVIGITLTLIVGAFIYKINPDHNIAKLLLQLSEREISKLSSIQRITHTLMYLGITAAISIGLLFSFRNRLYAILIFLIFIAGFCCSLIVSFSPTIYDSAERILLFNMVSIGLVTASLLLELVETTPLKFKKFFVISILFALFCIFINRIQLKTFQAPNTWSYDLAERLPEYPTSNESLPISVDIIKQADHNTELTQIAGWAYDPITRKSLERLLVKINDSTIIKCQYGKTRNDVRDAMNLKTESTGFSFNVPSYRIDAQKPSLHFIAIGSDNNIIYETHINNPESTSDITNKLPEIPATDTELSFCVDDISFNDNSTKLVGWAFDTKRKDKLHQLYIKANDSTFIRCEYEIPRNDVQKIMGLTSGKVGFSAKIPAQYIVGKGNLIQLIGISSNQKEIYKGDYNLSNFE